MQRTKIEWAEYTWNPVTGCLHGCEYCYARTMVKRFAGDVRLFMADKRCRKVGENIYEIEEKFIAQNGTTVIYPCEFLPTLHKYRFTKPRELKTGANIFVCSMADLFGNWVPDEWIEMVFDTCKEYSRHNYLYLTKNYNRYEELYHKGLLLCESNMWYGCSFTRPTELRTIANNNYHTFVSLEPLLGDVGFELSIRNEKVADWVIVGAETGQNKNKVVPLKEWIDHITEYCDRFGIPVFMKDSLINIVGEENMRRELPDELNRNELSAKRKEVMETHCGRCQQIKRKSEMTSITLRRGRRGEAKTVGYVCNECLPEFLKGFENNDGENNGGRSS